ncbi:aminotransferase class I/II-fold pyridoxal phosphate-dependent enzyme [Xylophilus sp. Kf1]|nr:aminotransferase class I/II-fold pyridoxal phosphate-dependent enzyme [Xylophilus sp. Kf1]
MNAAPRQHGGPDALGQVAFDFSTNANACGPEPGARQSVRDADARHYPDPQYRALREALGGRHGVPAGRIVPAASGSEAIQRLTARAVQRGVRRVVVPALAYGDYRHAAEAWGLTVRVEGEAESDAGGDRVAHPGDPADPADSLRWLCDPSSPLGRACPPPELLRHPATVVLDRAYGPLRLEGADPWRPATGGQGGQGGALDRVWQLHTPNKALGLTGIRGAYLIAPADADADEIAALDRLAASWCIGSHGVAMLHAWCRPGVDDWLAGCRDTLRAWKATQLQLCRDLGWHCLPSQANFFVARLPDGAPPDLLERLRAHGIRLRDGASFGLPGHVRLGVLPPASQQALRIAATTIGASPN